MSSRAFFREWKDNIPLLLSTALFYQHRQALDQRSSLVLCRHHNGHPSHAGDVGSCDCGGGQRWRGGGGLELQLRLAVCLRQRLSLGQLGVTLWPGKGASIGAGLRGDGLPAWQGGVVVTVVGGGGGTVVVGWSVAGRAARGGDDGGGVWGRSLGVLLQVVVVVVVVGGLFVVWARGDGGQGAILGDDIWTHATLSPGHTFGSLSVLPGV